MGDVADEVLNGDRCQECIIPFDTPGDGYPRTCRVCIPGENYTLGDCDAKLAAEFDQSRTRRRAKGARRA